MLQNVRVNQSEGSTDHASVNAVTCAGKVFNKTPHKVIDFNQRTWILDSGATQHMCFDSKIFLELNTLKTHVFVDLPYSHRVKITQGPSMKRPLAFGKARAGLYLLKSSFQYLKSFISTSAVAP
ncbi:hypothetical protein KY284_026947 [Solanum tuberosum]|nr:hypothetical protein KY284_026947 [Solanum tuberosum]